MYIRYVLSYLVSVGGTQTYSPAYLIYFFLTKTSWCIGQPKQDT
jgi:hypothetical protein